MLCSSGPGLVSRSMGYKPRSEQKTQKNHRIGVRGRGVTVTRSILMSLYIAQQSTIGNRRHINTFERRGEGGQKIILYIN